jgi:ADP-heptose:LPS heptosyltransferase
VRKILIVNLTRFGDLLQTSPTIVGLKELHPAAELTVLVERNFAEVARGLPGVDRVWELDLDDLGRVLLGATAVDLRTAYRTVEGQVEALRAERFDLALNYSSSRMSAVLLGLVGAADTRGWTMSPDGHRLIAHRWSRLFSASCLVRRQAAFNLVDYYKRVAGVPRGPERLFFTVPAAARARAEALLAAAGDAGRGPLVAFQLGASRAVRRWPAASFVALGRALARELGARLLLCGGAGDRAVADEIRAALGDRAIDVAGRTSVAELGALLERAAVLVTPDTGPMHMAVAVGTPVVALFFGPALPFDTGPYAPDELCLHAPVACAPCDHSITCLDPFCRDTLAPEAVAEAVALRLRGDWNAVAAAADRWPALDWYRTCFDGGGLADVARLGRRPAGRAERLRRAYRALWTAELERRWPLAGGSALEGEAALVRELARLADEGVGRAVRVARLARGGGERGLDLERLEAEARGLEDTDERLLRFGAVHEPAALLLQLFRFEKENLEGDDVAALAEATCGLHERLAARARLLADLLAPPGAGPERREDKRGSHHGEHDGSLRSASLG